MIKKIEIHGQSFELYSPDGGRTWSSSPQSIANYGRRKKLLRLELQKKFELIRPTEDLDSKKFTGLKSSKKSQKGKGEK